LSLPRWTISSTGLIHIHDGEFRLRAMRNAVC